eukprot:GHVS01012448.1.p1 GENE.GHVS01012448.1~~GHVS01012448.1.p1  ORF type:complete len:446 (+),score=52.00 GHVS01012448.1:160-1497(+)
MELDVGAQCSQTDCNQLDFLPFLCAHCNKLFCSTHRTPVSHECSACHVSEDLPGSECNFPGRTPSDSSSNITADRSGETLVVCDQCNVACVLVSDSLAPEEVERRLTEHRLTADCHMMRSKGRQCQMHGGCISVKTKAAASEGTINSATVEGPDSSLARGGKGKSMGGGTRMLCLCSACQSYFCLHHRHPEDHQCPSLEATRKPRRASANRALKSQREEEKEVEERFDSLRKTLSIRSEYTNVKTRRMAQQLRRMKIKMLAKGEQSVPTTDRLCVSVVLDREAVLAVVVGTKGRMGGKSTKSFGTNATDAEGDVFVWIDKSKNMQCAKDSVCKIAKVTNSSTSQRMAAGDSDSRSVGGKIVLWRRRPVDVGGPDDTKQLASAEAVAISSSGIDEVSGGIDSDTAAQLSSVGTTYSWEILSGGMMAGSCVVEGDLLVLSDDHFLMS